MTEHELKNIDAEDIEDLLAKVEVSFNIKFMNDELNHIRTFGQLCAHISNKIQLENSDDCTSQQAFYKLRKAISTTLQIEYNKITPDTSLNDLFPRTTRRSKVKILEQHLAFDLDILQPPHWITNGLLITLFISFVGLFFNWKFGLSGLGLSILGLWLANKVANELDLQTVAQIAKKMTSENYFQSRRNPKTCNKNEIENILKDWFSNNLALDKGELTRHTEFV
ncbi:hypothetical protein [Pedobacter sp. MW01-1-1]|uniref:hypothetical protein n=1 Tax=Pedobacter sp. MW01-1-1 TaxID=3383027 RepID=UPI003FF01CF4